MTTPTILVIASVAVSIFLIWRAGRGNSDA